MQSEMFEETRNEEDTAQTRTVGLTIPLYKETPVARAMRRIRSVMLKGMAPVVAYSSGKDSSALAALVLNAAREMREKGEHPMPVIVVHANTGVEQPEITQLALDELVKIKTYAKTHGLEVDVRVGHPTLSASFPARVIGGRALPAFPDSRGDCSISWKQDVTAKLMDQAFKDLGMRDDVQDIIVMTGVRQDESVARAQKIKLRGEVAEGVWENDHGKLRASPILDWTVEDVWEFLGYCAAGIEPSFSDFSDVMRIYAASGGDSCVIVADMKMAGHQKACGSRHGCWACTRVAADKSMDNMIASDTKRYGYLKPLAALRNFMSNTQYDWSRRQFVGRTVDADGHITIAADTYSPDMLAELLAYTLTAQIESGVQVISYQHLVAIDARWSLYGLAAPFTALKIFFEVMNGKRSRAPEVARFPKTPVPRIGKIYVGRQWEVLDGPNSLSGLRDVSRELHAEECGLNLKVLSSGNIVIDDESDEGMEVDEEGAIDFVEFLGEEMVAQHCRPDHPDWAAGYMTYLGHGTLQIAKGRSTQVDAILRRTRWRQANNLHGQRTVEELRERCTTLFAEQLELLAA
jgi:3'-phosphoadenosine 5'-phosphosulfate sulfotransferase (PAPS reductase)/FAD synthetase